MVILPFNYHWLSAGEWLAMRFGDKVLIITAVFDSTSGDHPRGKYARRGDDFIVEGRNLLEQHRGAPPSQGFRVKDRVFVPEKVENQNGSHLVLYSVTSGKFKVPKLVVSNGDKIERFIRDRILPGDATGLRRAALPTEVDRTACRLLSHRNWASPPTMEELMRLSMELARRCEIDPRRAWDALSANFSDVETLATSVSKFSSMRVSATRRWLAALTGLVSSPQVV
jgi:hypothetical protein